VNVNQDDGVIVTEPAPRCKRASYLPFAAPHITDAEINEVTDTLRSGWLSVGPKTKRFEAEFGAAVNASHAVACGSATAALHLALDAVGVGAGDEVIVPDYTFTASAMVAAHMGARPVIVDVSPRTCNLDPERFEAAITPKTRAVIVVDIAGLAADLDAILDIARSRGIAVVEDAAHAFPASYKGRMIGSISDITAFSFYATKALAVGDGGMLTTNNPEYAERAAIMSMHGISRDAWKRYSARGSWFYEVLAPGYKYNMTDISAAIGLHQLARRDWLLARRQHIAARYMSAFATVDELETPPDSTRDQHAWHLYMLRIHPERLTIDRAAFIERLADANIGVSVHFIPLHLHPFYRETYALQPGGYSVATDAYEREISLPIYPGMSDEDVDDVIAATLDIVQRYRQS
jgi:dTDP-4-amino-4,6-dideoxygalactose transaminase